MMTKIREGYKETEIGVIPEDWEATELSNISDLITKGTTPTTYGFDFVDEGVNFIKIESINDTYGTLIPSSFSKITNECHQKLNRSILKSGDILFAIAGATVGKCAMIKNEELPANTNQALAIIRLKENENKQFVFHQLRGYYIQQKISQIKTNTAQPNLNLKQIGDFKFAYPKSTCEQQRIAEILSTTDSHIEKLDKTIEDYQLLKKGMMKKLLTEGIGHTEFKETEIGMVPKEWEVKSLNSLCKIITKQTGFDYTASIKPNLLTESTENSIPFLQTKNFKGSSISLETDYYLPIEIAQNFPKILLDEKCLLFSIVGASVGNIGLFDESKLAFLGGAICIAKFIDTDVVDFVYYVMQSEIGQKQIKFYTKGAGQATITIEDIREILVPIPNKTEIEKISLGLRNVDKKLELLSDEKNDFIKLKNALMEKLLTGKVRVL